MSRRKENKKKKSRQQKISHAKTTSQGDRQPETFDRTYANHDVFGRPGSVTEIRGASSATTTLEYNHLSGSLTETHPSDHPYLPDLKVEARADDQRGRPTGHIVKSDGTSIHGWTTGYDTEGRVGSLEGHNLTASLAYHPGTKRLATQTTAPTGGGNPILTRATNIDLLGRTYGVIHTAPDPDAGNTPRVVTALAHGHDIQGRRKSARREDGTTWSYNYNDRSEVTGAEKRQSNSDLVPGLDFGYNHDGLGNRLSASKGLPALVTTYAPDAMNRYSTIESPGSDDILVRSATAVEVEVDETPVAVTTSGDFRGARVTATNTTAPAFPEITITGQDNFAESGNRWIPQAEFSPTYDDHGNLTNDGRWIYTWDAMNRLTGMTPTTVALTAGVPNQTLSFAYDHLGRRIAKKVTTTTGGNTTIKDWRYLYEGWNVVAQFTAVTSNAITPDATYLWSLDLSGTFHGAGGVGGLHSVNLYSGGAADTLCLASYDANGNIIAWTDSTGRLLQRQDYDPFGNRVIRERLAITPQQSERLEYGFSTKPLVAETGLIYYIHRYYGPRHGHWLSQDPIEEAGGLNLYGFVGNNGIERSDSLGLDGPFWDSIEAERRRRKDAPYGKLWVESTLRSEPAYASATGKLFGMPPALEKLIGVFGDGETVAISALPQGGGAYARLTGLVLDPTSSTDGDVLAHELVHAFNHRRKTGVPFAGYNDEGMASAMQNYLKSFQGPDGFAELEKLLNSMESRQFPGREEIEGIARKWAGGFEPYRIDRDLPVKGVNGKSFPLSEVDFRLLESHFGVRYTCEELASLYNNKPGVENGCIKFTCASLRSEGFPIRIDPDGIIWFGMNGPLRPYWIRR